MWYGFLIGVVVGANVGLVLISVLVSGRDKR